MTSVVVPSPPCRGTITATVMGFDSGVTQIATSLVLSNTARHGSDLVEPLAQIPSAQVVRGQEGRVPRLVGRSAGLDVVLERGADGICFILEARVA